MYNLQCMKLQGRLNLLYWPKDFETQKEMSKSVYLRVISTLSPQCKFPENFRFLEKLIPSRSPELQKKGGFVAACHYTRFADLHTEDCKLVVACKMQNRNATDKLNPQCSKLALLIMC